MEAQQKMKDAVTIREASEEDFPAVAKLFDRNNYGLRKEAWIHWKYLENPDGKGRLFVARDSEGNILGTVGFIPHSLVMVGGRTLIVMEAVDLFVGPEARGRKIAKKLLQYGLDNIQEKVIAFPNQLSERVTIEMGWKPLAPLETWVFPVRIDGGRTDKMFNSALPVVKMFSKNYARLFLPQNAYLIQSRILGEGELFQDTIMNYPSARSAAFLNWRFRNNPCKDYVAMEFLLYDQPIGYCIISIEKNCATIFDYFSTQYERRCLRQIVDYCVSRDIALLILRGVGLRLWHFGFIRYPSKIKVLCRGLEDRPCTLMLRDSDW
jgi:ribosomal protein S18 acetylase RimI-like enzyme